MKRTSHRRAIGRLPVLSAALLSAAGLLWDGARSGVAAQVYSGASSEVIVNYDVLNALPGQPAPYSAQGTQPNSQFLPGYAPQYAPQYAPLGAPAALPPYAPYGGLAIPPAGTPSSVLTTLGPDGRPITPITLRKPGSAEPDQTEESAEMAAISPPPEPEALPDEVPMPEPAPLAPAPGVNADMPAAAPVVEAPEPPMEEAAAEEAPVEETPAEEAPVEEAPAEAEAPAAEEAPADAPSEPSAEVAAAPAPEPPAEGEATKVEAAEGEPTEEATAETLAEPNNSQPAPPIPQGGIRIVFPTDLNEVPSEANAALDDLAAQMAVDESMRIQIMCYAAGDADTENKARRKALARCLNIRQYLFQKDVRTTRMDVRALGLKSEGQPADRVDIVPASS